MAQPRLVGAFVGLLLLSFLEFSTIPIRQWVLRLSPNSPLQLTLGLFIMVGFLRAWIFGVIIGQRCGFALYNWLAGNRKECKATLETTAINIVGFHVALFFVPLCIFTPDPRSGTLLTQYLPEVMECYIATFPLQIGIVLLWLARWLPADSEQTTQITEKLRL